MENHAKAGQALIFAVDVLWMVWQKPGNASMPNLENPFYPLCPGDFFSVYFLIRPGI